MATSKTITLLMQNQGNALAPTSVSVSVEAEVRDGVLVTGHRRTNPGVFTAGTAPESNGTNFNQDSVNG